MNKFYLLIVCILSPSGYSLERIMIGNDYAPQIIPFGFVVDAGEQAKRFSSKETIQYSFISSYVDALDDILSLDLKENDFEEDKNDCKVIKKIDFKVGPCGRYAAVKAVFDKKIELSFIDMGYAEREIIGVKKIDSQSDYDFELLITKSGNKYELVRKKELNIPENKSCIFDGYLSSESTYGPRGYNLERRFVVKKINCDETFIERLRQDGEI